MEYKLTESEAIGFVKNDLEIINYEELKHNKVALLDAIVYNFQTKIPFQNVVLLSTAPEERHRLTWEEIKNALFKKMGGMCYEMHVMFGVLLKALGYDVSWAHSRIESDDDHMVTLVRNLRFQGDLLLIEIGTIIPTFEPIPLDFEKESRMYRSAFLEYKFQRDGEIIRRLHRKGDTLASTLPERHYVDGWRQFCTFNPTLLYEDVHEFDECYHEVFSKDRSAPFHKAFLLLGYKNGKGLQVYGRNNLLKENEDGDLEAALLAYDDMVSLFKECFPSIPESVVQKAIAFVKKGTI